MSTRIRLDGLTPTKIAQAVLTLSDVTLYTATAPVVLSEIVLANTTSSSASVSISIVPVGGAAGAGNRIFEQIPVPAYSTVLVGDMGQVLPAGEFLTAKASVTASITLRASGVLI